MGSEQVKEVPPSLFGINVLDIKKQEVDLSKFKGKVLLVVNVASHCGYTDVSYTQLTSLYEKYKDRGLEILAFPCNQFLFQEFGSNESIHHFCTSKYKVEFPIFDKIKVNGSAAHPLYVFLKDKHPGSIGWNFEKFVVDREGNVKSRYPSKVSPFQLEDEIVKLLNAEVPKTVVQKAESDDEKEEKEDI